MSLYSYYNCVLLGCYGTIILYIGSGLPTAWLVPAAVHLQQVVDQLLHCSTWYQWGAELNKLTLIGLILVNLAQYCYTEHQLYHICTT
jgi:hypothetical protein